MKDFICKKVEQIKNDYINHHERVISDYEREIEDRQSYHGRELLELLQNADDEMIGELKPEARISFDGNKLIVSNNGKPFSEKGIHSLMLSNLSPKRKNKQLIGNKGTGFRSILSWAQNIRIDSGELHICFSPEHSSEMLYELFDGVLPEEMTAPTLAFPEWVDDDFSSEYTTTITITVFDDPAVQKDIERQIGRLNSEILIFLNNIKKLEIESLERSVCLVKECIDDWNVSLSTYRNEELIDRQEWFLNRSDNNIYGDKVYSVVIAYNLSGGLPQNSFLHAYFPTKIKFPFPVLLHADFEVDNNRNHLLNKKENTVILAKAAEMLVETAMCIYADEPASYSPLSFLIPIDGESLSVDLIDHEFDKSLNEAILNSEIFPTVKGEYVKFSSDLKYYSGKFASYVNGDSFFDLLQYTDDAYVDGFIIELVEDNNPYEYDEFVVRINAWIDQLPKNEASLKTIVECINSILADNELDYLLDAQWIEDDGPQLGFFFDSSFKELEYKEQKFISGDNGDIRDVPSFINTKSIHPVMEQSIKEHNLIMQHLDWFNIYEFSFKDLVDSANDYITSLDNVEERSTCCLELLQWVYVYSDNIEKTDDFYIMLPSRDGRIYKSSNMFLGKEYGNTIGESIVSCIDEDRFVVDVISLLDITRSEAIDFLNKLGVNRFPQIKKRRILFNVRYSAKADRKKYVYEIVKSFNYPISLEGGETFSSAPDFYKVLKDLTVNVNYIDKLETILEKARTKDIIAWIKADDNLRSALYSELELTCKTIDLKWHNMTVDRHYDHSVPSFMRWIFKNVGWIEVGETRYKITDCLLANYDGVDLSPHLVFPNVGEYVSELSGKIKKHKDEYSSVLLNVGMQEDFSELDISKIYEVLLALPGLQGSSKIAKRFYESILEDSARKRLQDELSVSKCKAYSDFIKSGKVYCKNGSFVDVKEACYISKKDVCESILVTANVLNVSGRIAYKSIPKMLGVKELKIQGMRMVNYDVHPSSVAFTKELNRYKALAFTYRVNAKQNVKSQARKFSKLEIVLCSNIELSHNESHFFLNDGEFYREGEDLFYLCYPSYEQNKRGVKLGMGIANIICSQLDVYENKSDFRELFTAGSQSERIAILHDEFDDETINKARKMMNSDEDIRDEFINVIDELSDQDITKFTRYIDSIDFEEMSSLYNAEKIRVLFKKLGIDVEDFNKKADFRIDLIPYYESEIDRIVPQYRDMYMYTNYRRLQNESIDNQLSLQGTFLNYDYLCKNIIIRNSVYFEPANELMEQLSIDPNVEELDLKELFSNNRNAFIEMIGDDAFIGDFFSKTENASLLYYGQFDELKMRYQLFANSHRSEDDGSATDSNKTLTARFVDVEVSAKAIQPIEKAAGNRRSPTTTGFKDRSKSNTRIGMKGEELVYNALMSNPEFKFVKWKSENAQKAGVNPEGSASFGYDIEYVDKDNKRCYVEVKTTTGSLKDGISFHLSSYEYQIAVEHGDSYYVYYVSNVDSDPTISVLKDLIVDSESNLEKYTFLVSEYIVACNAEPIE